MQHVGARAARAQENFIILKGRNGLPQSLCVSPAGSVGASALQRCPPDTRTAMASHISADKNTGSAVKQSLYFYLSLSSFISSSAYLQHCSTKRLKEMLSAAAARLSLSKSCSVKRTVRGILAFFISLSILNITITFMDIITYFRLCFYNRFWLQKRCLKVI